MIDLSAVDTTRTEATERAMIAGGTASSAERRSSRPRGRSTGWCASSATDSCRTGLRYCGGDENRLLFDHAVEQVVDGGLKGHLEVYRRAALPPAHRPRQRHRGPVRSEGRRLLDRQRLLDRVEMRQLYDALLERFGKQLQGRTRDLVLGTAPSPSAPQFSRPRRP